MGFLGGGVKIFGGNPPRNAMTADLRRLVKKIMEMLQIPLSVHSAKKLQKNIKKRNVYAVRVIFHPCAALTPLNP